MFIAFVIIITTIIIIYQAININVKLIIAMTLVLLLPVMVTNQRKAFKITLQLELHVQ